MRDDELILECLEDVHYHLETALQRVKKARSIHVRQLEQLCEELRSQRRLLEDISFPARLIVEHLLECQSKGGQVAVEAGQIAQSFTLVSAVKIEEFGLIKAGLGKLELSWRDGDYTYYLYPDKVELRAADEKSAIKLFFSLAFSLQEVERFPELLRSPNLVYIHPQLEKWLRKVEA